MSISNKLEEEKKIETYFYCDKCEYLFPEKGNFQNHLCSHLFHCSLCQKQFEKKSYLNDHIQAVHPVNSECNVPIEQQKVKCHICSKELEGTQSMKLHIQIVHDKIKKFECYICFKKHGRKHELSQHITRVHEKVFKPRLLKLTPCPQCDQRFTRKTNLEVHIQAVHDKIKPFGCDICDSKFGHKLRTVIVKRKILSQLKIKIIIQR